jgi:uncharacterized protein (DUF2267 family)
MNRTEELLDNIYEAVKMLDRVDEMQEEQKGLIQNIDWQISDYLHYIENEEIDEKQAYIIINELKELRLTRRDLSNESIIESVFNKVRDRLNTTQNRKFFAVEIHKEVNKLNQDYNWRAINKEQIEEIINSESHKKKAGRPKKNKEEVENEKNE